MEGRFLKEEYEMKKNSYRYKNDNIMMNYKLLTIPLMLLCAACGKEKKASELNETSVETVLPSETNEVTAIPLVRSEFHHELISNGKIEARNQAKLYFESAGAIARIYVKNGESVRKGQKLAELEPFRLKNQLDIATDALEKAKLELQDVLIGQGYMLADSARVPADILKLAKVQSGYEQALASYELAEYEWKQSVLTAPFDGIVANLTAKAYNQASTSEAFCTIIDNSLLEASFTILENELPLIRIGDRVEVQPFAVSGLKATGSISEINPLVDENGMVQVKALVGGSDKLFEGMNVQVSIQRSLPNQLVVPKEAIVLRSGKQVLFTLKDSKAMWVYVHTGLENATSYTLVDDGEVKVGDSIITSGNINLAHESPVKLVE